MLYHFLYPLHTSLSGLNVFRYITFRSIGGAVTAFLIVLILGQLFIRTMRHYQIGQVVRDDGPETHLAKQGVPTMGGLLILSAITFGTLLWARLDNSLVWLVLFITLFYGSIGSLDDFRKIKKKISK
jgi:phospho-N-acetylmuramoyl-pentapeptide-transferase